MTKKHRDEEEGWIPFFKGMTERDKGIRFHLSFPNVSIGNPENSKGMDSRFRGNDCSLCLPEKHFPHSHPEER